MYALPKVEFLTAVKNCLKNYINFKGRIRRSEYWFFLLPVNFITVLFLTLFLLYVTGTLGKWYYYYTDYSYYDYYSHSYPYYNYTVHYNDEASLALGILFGIHIFFVMLPTLSATVRRLHDVGKPGEMIFIGLVPFFGGLALLILLCTDSMRETNEYGPSPKYPSMDEMALNINMNAPTQSMTVPLMSPDFSTPNQKVNPQEKVSPLINRQIKPQINTQVNPQSNSQIIQMNEIDEKKNN